MSRYQTAAELHLAAVGDDDLLREWASRYESRLAPPPPREKQVPIHSAAGAFWDLASATGGAPLLTATKADYEWRA